MGTIDIEIGTKMKWNDNDPAIEEFEGKERELQKSRIYEVVDIINSTNMPNMVKEKLNLPIIVIS